MKGSVAKIKARNQASPAALIRPELFPIVGIGASAGGLEAISALLRSLPQKTGMAFVLVQHLDPAHCSDLRDILARIARIPVELVTETVAVQPDHIYVIPPNSGMEIKNGVLRLTERALTRGQHMPIDRFLRTLAQDRGNRAISVILSGTASDGTEGSRAIKAAGGITFAQDEESAKYSSMPHSAITAGCVDFVLPPAAISKELTRVAQHPYLAQAPVEKPGLDIATGGQMEALLLLLRAAIGVDFTHYKQTTLRRRIERRMALRKLEKLKDYVRYVRNTPAEIEELYKDILIHVTGFFRDPEAYEGLRKNVLPVLFPNKQKAGTVRVWVPGCSTGEEAYSLAMTMLEYLWLETTKTAKSDLGATPFQIFATDLSEGSLDRARGGLYSEALVAGVSPERLRRFFTKIDGGYQIVKPVREMCIFAKQNVVKDPPFSNLDLISCRNLLIYLDSVLQKRVVPILHYALKPSGFLMLGEAESLGAYSEFFTPLDKKNRIFQKKNSPARMQTYFSSPDFNLHPSTDAKIAAQPAPMLEQEVERLLLQRFAPASIVVNEQRDIVHFRGKTGPYLEPATGQPTFNLAKMAREGLLVDLRAALTEARKKNATVRRSGVRVRANSHTHQVNFEVSPLRRQPSGEHFYLIVFRKADPAQSRDYKQSMKTPPAKTGGSQENARLKHELAQTREQFQTLIEEHETVSEEFKAANEEVLSANEELQSTNEELETAKEELQSSNEELTTLNEELQFRNSEVTAVNADLLNVLSNITLPMVIVGQDLRIRRYTTPAQKLLNLLPSDVGRRLSDIRPNLDVEDLGQIASESIENVSTVEREVRETGTGTWHLMRVRPYKTWDSKIDGAVISFQDIDAMKRSLDQMHLHADALIETAREAILILDANLRVLSANLAFYRNFEVAREETQNRPIYDLGNGQWNIPKLRELLENVLPNNGRVEDFEVSHEFPRLGPRRMMLNARRIEPQPGQRLILLYIEDVTDGKK